MAESAEPQRYRAGETIFVRGDVGDALYVVEVGIVSVHAAGGEEVRRFGVKEVFGEVALLNDDGRRTADAIAATDCVLLAITRDAFTAIAGPSIKAALHGADIANVPLFAHLDVKQIAALAEATRLVKFSDGDEVIRAGMPPECLFTWTRGRSRSLAPALASARGAPWRRTAAYFAGATRWRGRRGRKNGPAANTLENLPC